MRTINFLFANFLFASFLLVLSACSSQNTPPKEEVVSEPAVPLPDTGINILFIGNSLTYANDLPGMLERMLLLADIEIGHIESQSVPNFGLPDHWERPDTRAQLDREGWDIVILQQGPSATEGRPYLLEYAPLFAEEAAKSGAQTALYMVWPARIRYFDFPGVSDSYRMAAINIEGLFFPAGEAWLNAWEQDQSLNLYGPDAFHPSVTGTYLAALTMFEQIANLDPEELPNIIPASSGDIELTPEIATILKQAAKLANREFAINTPLSYGSKSQQNIGDQ